MVSKVKEIFLKIVALDKEERNLFLEKIREKDSLLWKELKSLLEKSNSDSGIFSMKVNFSSSQLLETLSYIEVSKDYIGVRFGDFKAVELFSSGGHGLLYKGRSDRGSQAIIKLPVPFLEAKVVRRFFEREARFYVQLQDFPVPKFYCWGMHKGEIPYIVREFVEGTVLKRGMGEEVLKMVIETVFKFHDAGVILGDVSPSNFILSKDRLVLIDLGTLSWEHERLPAYWPFNPDFSAPWVKKGVPPSRSSDQYSLLLTVAYLADDKVSRYVAETLKSFGKKDYLTKKELYKIIKL